VELGELDRLSRVRCRLPITLGANGEVLEDRHRAELSFAATRDWHDEDRLKRLLIPRRLGVQSHNGLPFGWGENVQFLGDDLVEWATTKGRTSKELLTAIEELRKIEDLVLRPSERLMNQYFAVRSMLTGHEPISSVRGELGGVKWLALTAHESLPFERERSFKALDAMASLRVAYLAGREQTAIYAYRDPVFASRLPEEGPFYREDDVSIATSPSDRDHHLLSIFQLKHARTSYLASLAWGEPHLDGPLRDWKRGLAWRRAERTRLALIAYRIDHDEYPEKLEALAPDYLAAGELHDLYSGQPLGWEPKGFDLPVADAGQDAIAEGTPVLWSGGPYQTKPTRGKAVWDEARRRLTPLRDPGYGDPTEEANSVPAYASGEYGAPIGYGFTLAVPE
jgi:hypothetical protein